LSALISCGKQLNVFPTTSEVDGNVITDLQGAKTTLNGVYYLFADAGVDYNNNPSILWCDLNETIPSELSGLMTYPYGGSVFANHSYIATTSGVGNIWNYGYKIVNAANGFLKNIATATNIPASDKQSMIAEAKFLRAYANAELLFFYGQYDDITSDYGIILRKDFITTENVTLPRNTVKESYDFILSDVDSAIAGLPNLNSKNYYANVWTAKLLKARVLMERASNGDYTQAQSLCADIITNGPFALENSTKDIFLSKGLSSSEVILGIKPFSNDIYKFNEYLDYYQAVGSDSLVSLLSGDPRSQWIYQTIPNPYFGTPMHVFKKYYPGMVDHPSPTDNSSVSYAMRLSEAYLLEAEAITDGGGNIDDAKALLKTVMSHAGITDFSQVDAANSAAELKLLIVKEDMKNFVGEAGQDWLAVRRLPFTTLQQLLPTITKKTQLILPIPQEEMTRNIDLKGMQNPGYGN
jgi:hypothetical protein